MHELTPRFGKIDQVGDPNKQEEAGRYRVRLADELIVTGWLFQLKMSVLNNQQDWVYDIGEPVMVFLWDDNRTGVIMGSINTSKSPNATTDKDTQQMKFKDGSYIKYNRNSHQYDISIKSGKANIVADDDITVKSNNGTVILNDGSNNGIPIEAKIEENFNSLKTYIDEKFAAVVAGFGGIGIDGGSGLAAYNAVVVPPFNVEDMKNTKAKH